MTTYKMKILVLCMLILAVQLIAGIDAQAQCSDNGNLWSESWRSCTKSSNPNAAYGLSQWIMYEFEQNQIIAQSHFWNANRTGQSGDGIQEMIIDYSADGINWVNLGTFALNQAPETEDYGGQAGPDFGSVSIKKILITVQSTFNGGACASLAEVRFELDQSACNGVIDECGNCDGPGAPIWYLDADADGLGDAAISLSNCEQPEGYVGNADDLCDDGTLGWVDMASIFESNTCTSCHGNNATSGLNLLTYDTFVQGGNNCGSAILSGTNLVDIIQTGNVSCDNGVVNAAMNINVGFLVDESELTAIQQWINNGAPELCNEQAVILSCEPGAGCDDGDVCTVEDTYDLECNCQGQLLDENEDGICDLNNTAETVEDVIPEEDLPPCQLQGGVDEYVLTCNTVAMLDVLSNDDPASSLTIVSQPASGQLTVQNQQLQYSATSSSIGLFEFTYEICGENACCTEVVSSITIESCIDPMPEGMLYHYHEISNCNMAESRLDLSIYSQIPGQTVFYKLFYPDGSMYAQNSTNGYPVLFKQVPSGNYTIELSSLEMTETLELSLSCLSVQEDSVEPADDPCVFEYYEESDCDEGESTLSIFVSLGEGPAFHKLYNENGEEVRINSTTNNPCVFKNLGGGAYELHIYYLECVDIIPVFLNCE